MPVKLPTGVGFLQPRSGWLTDRSAGLLPAARAHLGHRGRVLEAVLTCSASALFWFRCLRRSMPRILTHSWSEHLWVNFPGLAGPADQVLADILIMGVDDGSLQNQRVILDGLGRQAGLIQDLDVLLYGMGVKADPMPRAPDSPLYTGRTMGLMVHACSTPTSRCVTARGFGLDT